MESPPPMIVVAFCLSQRFSNSNGTMSDSAFRIQLHRSVPSAFFIMFNAYRSVIHPSQRVNTPICPPIALENVRHTTTDDQCIYFVKKVVDYRILLETLAPPRIATNGLFRIVYCVSKEIDLLLHQISNNCCINIFVTPTLEQCAL